MKQPNELYRPMKEDRKLINWDGVIYVAACIVSAVIAVFIGRFVWGLLP